jgi:hypothetical protein
LTRFSWRDTHDQQTYLVALSGPVYLISRSVSASHLSQRLTFSTPALDIEFPRSFSLVREYLIQKLAEAQTKKPGVLG